VPGVDDADPRIQVGVLVPSVAVTVAPRALSTVIGSTVANALVVM